MLIVWDEPKRLANIAAHGLDFADAERFEWEAALVRPTYPGRSGALRFKAIGRLGERVIVIIFSPLGAEALSIISVRPASAKERAGYEQG